MVVKQDIIFMKKDYGLLLIAVEEDRSQMVATLKPILKVMFLL